MSGKFDLEAILSMTDKLTGPMKQATASTAGFSRKMQGSFNRTGAAASGLGSMVGGLIPVLSAAAALKFGNDAIKAWHVQEAAIANVEAGLKSTQNAVGITSQQFQDMASKAQGQGIIGDETILQNATAQLLTFGSIGKQSFERVQNAALDVAVKLDGITVAGDKVKAVSIMMGKAMDDPVRGMGALRKAGLQFTDQQEAMIKAIAKGGDKTKAQQYMLREIEKLYGGTNKALRDTTAGMEIAAKMDLGDSMEQVGKQLVPIKMTLLNLAMEILPVFNKHLSKIVTAAKLAAGAFILWKVSILALQGIGFIVMAAGWIKYLWMMRDVIGGTIARTNLLAAAQALLNAVMYANPIGLVMLAILALGVVIYQLYNNWETVKLGFLIGLNQIVVGWKLVKAQVLDVLQMMGQVSAQTAAMAKAEFLTAKLEGDIMKSQQRILIADKNKGGDMTLDDLNQKYRSPGTGNVMSTLTNRSQVDVNFNNAPKGTDIKQSGRTSPGTTLNLGVN